MSSGIKNKQSYKSLSEEQLLKKAKRRDHKAFEELLDRTSDYIVSSISSFSKGRYDDTELYQKACIKSWKYIDRFRGDCKFSTWMYRMVRHICCDEYRKQSRSKEVSYDGLLDSQDEGLGWMEKKMPVVDAVRAKDMDMKFLKKILNQSINRLSDKHKEVLLLFGEEELTYAEIAERLNCSVGTVMSRLFYARRQAQRHYKLQMSKVFSLTKEE